MSFTEKLSLEANHGQKFLDFLSGELERVERQIGVLSNNPSSFPQEQIQELHEAINSLLQQPLSAGEKERLLLGKQTFERVYPLQLAPQEGLCLLRAGKNQFANRLGSAACSCHAARALIQMLTSGIRDSETLDNVLDQGMIDYQDALRTLGREARERGAVLNNNFSNGRFLGWSEAGRFYQNELVSAGPVISHYLQQGASEISWLTALGELARCSRGEAIGAMVLVGYEFYSLLLVPAHNSWDVFFYDSHGSSMSEGNSFLALANGLEEAARVLTLRRPFKISSRDDYNLLTIYPLTLTPFCRAQTVGNRMGTNNCVSREAPQRPVQDYKEDGSFSGAQEKGKGGDPADSLGQKMVGGTPVQRKEAQMRFSEMQGGIQRLLKEGESGSFESRIQKIGKWISDFVLFTVFHPNPALQRSLKEILNTWMDECLPDLVAFALKSSSHASSSQPKDLRLAISGLRALKGFIHDYMQAVQQTKRGFLTRLMFGNPSSQGMMGDIVHMMRNSKGYFRAPEILSAQEHQRRILEQLCQELMPVFCRMGNQDAGVLDAIETHLPTLLGTFLDAITNPVWVEAAAVDLLEKGLPECQFQEASPKEEGTLPKELQDELIETLRELLQCSDPRYTAQILSLCFQQILSQIQQPGVAVKTLILFVKGIKNVFGAIGITGQLFSQTRAPRTLDLLGLASTLSERCDPTLDCLEQARNLTPEQREGLPKRISEAVVARIRTLPFYTGKMVMQFSSIRHSVETLVERLFSVAQNPDLLRLFIYSYLIEDALIPTLREVNRQHPPLPRLAATSEIDEQALIGSTARKMTETTVAAIRYLNGTLLNEDFPLNRALVEFSSGVLGKILSPLYIKMIEDGKKAPSETAQKMACRSYGKLADFLQDFGCADHLIRADAGHQEMSAPQREEALLKLMDLQRRKRGVPSLKISLKDQETKLKALASVFIAHGTASFSRAEREAVAAVGFLFPKMLHRILQKIVSPDLFLRMIESSLSHPSLETSGLAGPGASEGWGKEALKIWNRNIQKIMIAYVDLGEVSEEYGYVKGIVDEGMDFLGREVGVHPLSMISGPHNLFSAHAYASFTNILASMFWKMGQDGVKVASLKHNEPMSAAERSALKLRLKETLNRKFYHSLVGSCYVPAALKTVGNEKIVTDFCDHIAEKLFFVTQSPKILEALFYNYLLEDLFPEIVQILNPDTGARAALNQVLPAATVLDHRGLYWELNARDVPWPEVAASFTSSAVSDQTKNALFELEILQTNWGVSSLFSLLDHWSQECPELKGEIDALRKAAGDPLLFGKQTLHLLRSLSALNRFPKEKLAAFFDLTVQREYAVLFAVLDQLLFPGDFHGEHSVVSEMEAWLENPGSSSLIQTLSIHALQKDFSLFVRSIIPSLETVFQKELAGSATLETIKTSLKMLLSKKDLAPGERQGIQHILEQLNGESGDPLALAIRIFRGKRNLACWEARIDVLLADVSHGLPFSILNSFYKKFCAITPDLLAFPMTPWQRVCVLEHLKEKFLSAVTRNATPLGVLSPFPHAATVFQDSSLGIQQKLALIQEAEESIFLSGCYLGGHIFDRTLEEMHQQLKRKPQLKIKILGSDNMINEGNRARLKALREQYPDRVDCLIHPEVFACSPGAQSAFTLNSNHVKILIIDHGKKFIVGGSGIADKWAYQDGTRSDLMSSSRPSVPLAFRDTDFLVHSPHSRGVGRSLNAAVQGWFSQLKAVLTKDQKMALLDPEMLDPWVQENQKDEFDFDQAEVGNGMEAVGIKAYLSGPMKEGNPFFEDLVNAIDQAQESIHIDHMYFHPPKRLMNALIAASNRGIGIILVTNRDSSEMPWTHALFTALSKQNWQELHEGRVKQNVSIFEYDRNYTTLHKKIIVVDEEMVFTGSSNIGKKSMECLDTELDLLLISKELGQRVVENIIEDTSRSELVPEQQAPLGTLSATALAQGQNFLFSRFL